MILAGDIGGTKTRLGLFRCSGREVKPEVIETLKSGEVKAFPDLLRRFLDQHPAEVESACLGAPGPVFEGEVDPPNLEWDVDEKEICQVLGTDAVRLVNDLVATAAVLPHLQPDQLLTLYEGEISATAREYRRVVLAPGTGLGQALMVTRDGEPRLYPSEGGHGDFAPASEMEWKLWQFLNRRNGRVTWEDVLSGPGIENLYDFLLATKYHREPEGLQERFEAEEDRAKVISESGQAGEEDICVEVMERFVRLLGSHAGNMALAFRANGGVFLGGGIPPKIVKALRQGSVVNTFLDKPPMIELLERIPLHVILDDHAAMHGASRIAARLCSDG